MQLMGTTTGAKAAPEIIDETRKRGKSVFADQLVRGGLRWPATNDASWPRNRT